MVNYYVDALNGNDSNTGLFGSAWATTNQVNAKIVDGTIKRNDNVYFARGQTFYGNIVTQALSQSGSGSLTIDAWGHGPAPRIVGYKISTAAWTLNSPNVWRLNIAPGSADITGFVSGTSTDVGHLRVNGEFKPYKRSTLGGLVNDWDFYSDETYVYVRLASNPGAGVEIAVKHSGVVVGSYTTTRNLNVIGFGAHGFFGTDVNQIVVEGLIIYGIGGCYIGGTTTRYGNGIEGLVNPRNWTVVGNRISQTYDVAMTLQGAMAGGGARDVLFARNYITNCNMGIEFWSTLSDPNASAFRRVKVLENIFVNSGESWGAQVRPDNTGKGIHILTYDMQGTTDIEIRKNVFWNAKDALAWYRTAKPTGMTVSDNTIMLKRGTKITWQDTDTIQAPGTNPYIGPRSRLFILPTSYTSFDDVIAMMGAQAAFSTEVAQYWRAGETSA